MARALYEAAQAGADAFILQDLAAVRLAREVALQVQRHGSTQMSVHTLSGALQLYEMGFSRVVLARELAGRQIQEIVNGLRDRSVPLETECLVHGAHCMCVSGQCYLSAFLGGTQRKPRPLRPALQAAFFSYRGTEFYERKNRLQQSGKLQPLRSCPQPKGFVFAASAAPAGSFGCGQPEN